MKTHARTLASLALIALVACGAPQGGGDDSASPIAVTPADDLAQVVADAPSGAILDLADGTYAVSMPLEIDKPMTLRGSDPGQVTITNAMPALQTRQLGEGPAVVLVSAGGFSASGITFAYEGTLDANVVTVRDASVDIDDCVFSGGVRTQATVDSETYLGVGLDLLGATSGTVANSRFTMNEGDGLRAAGTSTVSVVDNEASDNQIGITVENDATPTLQGNDVSGNTLWGIFYVSNGGGTASGNTISDNTFEGVMVLGNATPTLSANTVMGNGGKGIWVRESADATLLGNTIDGNGGDGIAFDGAASGSADNNTIGRNGPLSLGIRVSTTSPVTATGNAIANTGEMAIFFDVQATGSATANTIQDSGSHGILVIGEADVTLADNVISGSAGWGIVFEGTSTGSVTGNTLTDNTVGLRVLDSATPSASGNTIASNGRGVEFVDTAGGTLDDNVIELSTSDGVRVQGSSTPTITNNAIDDNGACGILLSDSSDPTLSGNTFSGNGTGTICDQRVP